MKNGLSEMKLTVAGIVSGSLALLSNETKSQKGYLNANLKILLTYETFRSNLSLNQFDYRGI